MTQYKVTLTDKGHELYDKWNGKGLVVDVQRLFDMITTVDAKIDMYGDAPTDTFSLYASMSWIYSTVHKNNRNPPYDTFLEFIREGYITILEV